LIKRDYRLRDEDQPFGLGLIVSQLLPSSVGAGALGVTAIILLYPRLPTARIVGSDIAHAVPLTLTARVGHWMLGSIDWHLLGSLLAGSLPGIVIGSYFSVRVPDAILRFTLATTIDPRRRQARAVTVSTRSRRRSALHGLQPTNWHRTTGQ
jgi:hypothetical protein